jgi:lactoylglutathione lyase
MPARKPKRAKAKPRMRKRSKAKAARKPSKTSRAKPRAPKRAAARPKKAAKRARKPTPAARRKTPMPPPAPNAIGVQIQHLDYTTHDFEAVKRFYGELLGFSHQRYDPEMGYLSLKTGPNASIGFSAPMPGPPEQWRPPREPALYFIVANVDVTYRELMAKGVSFEQPPTNMFWGHRACWTHDPEGRIVYLAQRINL